MDVNYVLITGGTGFIGKPLCQLLLDQGWKVCVLTRNPKQADLLQHPHLHYVQHLQNVPLEQPLDAVINLAGQPLDSHRWSEKTKQHFIQSRTALTSSLVSWIKQLDKPPDVLISGSAIGWYGHHNTEALTESSTANPCFANDLCSQWEAAAQVLQNIGTRLCLLRIGIVLEKDGGPLAALLPSYRFGMGGKIGDGQQYWSWIHRKDLIDSILFLLNNSDINGPVNATAPCPVTQNEFSQALGKVLNRPTLFNMPEFLATLLLGEFAQELLIKGQRVIPKTLENAGFEFTFANLDNALDNIINIHKA